MQHETDRDDYSEFDWKRDEPEDGQQSVFGFRIHVLSRESDEDFARARDILTSEVLPEWAERAGGDWATRWNDSVGKVVGVEIK